MTLSALAGILQKEKKLSEDSHGVMAAMREALKGLASLQVQRLKIDNMRRKVIDFLLRFEMLPPLEAILAGLTPAQISFQC